VGTLEATPYSFVVIAIDHIMIEGRWLELYSRFSRAGCLRGQEWIHDLDGCPPTIDRKWRSHQV